MSSSCHAAPLGVLALVGAALVTTLHAQTVNLGESKETSSEPLVLVVEWNRFPQGGKTFTETRRVPRSKSVQVKIRNFNFIRYTLTTTTKDTVVPGYSFLESIWKQIIPSVATGGKGDERASKPFLRSLALWRKRIEVTRDSLQTASRDLPKTVEITDMSRVTLWREWADTALVRLERTAKEAYDAIIDTASTNETYYAQILYDSELERSNTVRNALQAFRRAAKETEEGRVITLASRTPGTRVIVTLAVSADPTDTAAVRYLKEKDVKPVTIEYFVSSDLPVVFHGGPVGSKIENFKFDKVAVANTDFYRQIDSPDQSIDAAAFLSYALFDLNAIDRGVLASIGTNFRKPGEKLYVGLTLQFTRRLLFTGGAVTTLLEEGQEQVPDQIDLFRTLKEKRKWGGFIAFSAIPY